MDIISHYFPDLSEVQIKQFQVFQPLYETWNNKINVISRKDINHLYEHHILHSLAIAKVIQFRPGSIVMDAGTGGGFPGLPLAVLFPETQFVLVDSIAKKIRVVKEVSISLGLTNVEVINERMEKVNSEFDFIVSRAVTSLSVMWEWIRKKIKEEAKNQIPNGLLYLKGEDYTNELPTVKVCNQAYNIKEFYEEKYFETKKVVHIYRKE